MCLLIASICCRPPCPLGLAQLAWCFVNDSFEAFCVGTDRALLPLCLAHPPHCVAVAVIRLAAAFYLVDSDDLAIASACDAFEDSESDQAAVKAICSALLSLYEREGWGAVVASAGATVGPSLSESAALSVPSATAAANGSDANCTSRAAELGDDQDGARVGASKPAACPQTTQTSLEAALDPALKAVRVDLCCALVRFCLVLSSSLTAARWSPDNRAARGLRATARPRI
eukprot:SAG31_NODE_3782_length_3884_cov_1.601057_3_plen_230_part_00